VADDLLADHPNTRLRKIISPSLLLSQIDRLPGASRKLSFGAQRSRRLIQTHPIDSLLAGFQLDPDQVAFHV
jgi:hypothetical protein